LRQFGANTAQALERLAAGVAQSCAGICEFQAASFLDEQADAQVLFQHFELTADGTVGHVQLFGGLTDAVQPGGGFERTQGVQRGKVVAHGVCEFS
jgi:hypothetical protein